MSKLPRAHKVAQPALVKPGLRVVGGSKTSPLLPHQSQAVADLPPPAIAIMGGFGSGKTKGLVAWMIDRSARNPPSVVGLVVEPTHRQVRQVLIPEFVKMFDRMGVWHQINKTDWTITWGPQKREIRTASGEIPENMSGQTVGFAAMDEFGLMQEEVDNRLVSRCRDPDAVINQILYVGTPEGGGWSYEKIQKIRTIYAKSRDNFYLTQEALTRLDEQYKHDGNRYAMYVLGEPRKIAGNSYTNFHPPRHVVGCDNPTGGRLVLGADFNVGLMITPYARQVGTELHVLGEVVSRHSNTEAHFSRVRDVLIEAGLARHGSTQFFSGLLDHHGNAVEIWVDASSTARKTSSTRSDRAILQELGFQPRHNARNPGVRDRIETVQHALGHGRLYVDPDARMTIKALAEHDYQPGSFPPTPRKQWGDKDALDAATDALGYMICGVLPITNARVGRTG